MDNLPLLMQARAPRKRKPVNLHKLTSPRNSFSERGRARVPDLSFSMSWFVSCSSSSLCLCGQQGKKAP
jgi:hypothetical protein